MAEKPLNDQDIIEMLSELRDETPEYPPELMRSQKSTFLKRVVDLDVSGDDQSGWGEQKGGSAGHTGGSGITWAELSGGASATGSSSKTAIAVSIIVVLLAAAYLFRDQIVELLVENEIISVTETASSSVVLVPTEQPTATPTALAFGAPSPEGEATRKPSGNVGSGATAAAPGFGDNNNGGGVPVTGSSSDAVTATPPPGLIQNPETLGTPTPPPKGLVGRLRFLVCILRADAADCE